MPFTNNAVLTEALLFPSKDQTNEDAICMLITGPNRYREKPSPSASRAGGTAGRTATWKAGETTELFCHSWATTAPVAALGVMWLHHMAPGHPVPIPGDTGAQVTSPSPHLLLGRRVQLMGRMGNLLLRVGRRGYQAGIKKPRLRITDLFTYLFTKIQDRSLRSLQISKMLSTAKDCDIRTSDTKEILKKSSL